MKISIQYFASVREQLGREGEELELPAGIDRVEHLIEHLAEKRGESWRSTLLDGQVLVAVNQHMSRRNARLAAGDEVAFFPPVTGG